MRGEREERGRHERRDRRAGGGGRSNKAINRDLGIGRQGPGLASLSTPRRAIWFVVAAVSQATRTRDVS